MFRVIINTFLMILTTWLMISWIASFGWPNRFWAARFDFDMPLGIGGGIVVRDHGARQCVICNQWIRNESSTKNVSLGGIQYFSNQNTMNISMPVWIAISLLAFYPTICFLRRPLRRYRCRRRGLCVQCGYNLTGAPQPRCPECGTAP